MTLHQRRTHPRYVDGCLPCKWSSVQINAQGPTPQTALEARWIPDMDAFKRMVDQGYMPAQIDGAAYVEANATTRFEIESGMGVADDAKQMQEALTIVEDATGFNAMTPVTTPKETIPA
jgi:hypothetical protein